MVGCIFAWYYANHPMHINVWFYRLVGEQTFELGESKIKVPENCAIDAKSKSEIALVSFVCAVTSKKLEGVDIFKSFGTEWDIQQIKKRATEVVEFENYIYIVVRSKQKQEESISFYYLKQQNIIISSYSKELAKKFSDLLIEYNFRVEGAKESIVLSLCYEALLKIEKLKGESMLC